MAEFEQQIDVLHLEDLRNEAHPSVFDENEGYDMLIVRLPVIGKTLEARSLGFVITADGSWLYNRESRTFELLGERFGGPYGMIDTLTDALLKGFAVYNEQIVEMEERLYTDRAPEQFMTGWLGLKRDVLRIERILLRTASTVGEVIEHYEVVEGFPLNHYADLHEHLDRTVRSAALQLSKLDYLYNFHNARTNEKMNRMIYLLTIISAIFLPLNLLVGFFGMNTGGLPFAESPGGTLSAVLLMGSLALLTTAVVYVWRRRLDKT